MKQVYRFDDAGQYLEPVLIGENDPLPADCTEKPLPQPNWKPIFNKTKKAWVETITEEEKQTIANVEQPKSELEIVKEQNAELNLQIIEIWETLINGGVA